MAIIGSSLPRLGAIERVTGAQQYAADVRLDNTLHVKLVSVGCAHARIIAVHKGEALGVPGVRGVFTAHDLPQPVPRYGPVFADRPMLAVGETKFSGEPVAAVVAETKDAAKRAATLVRIDIEELPAVLSIEARSMRRPRSSRIRISGQTIRLRPRTRFANGSSDGATRRRHRRSRHRARLRVSDGHALRDRAARVSRGRRRERRHDLEPDAASLRAPACSGGRTSVADRESPDYRPRSRRRLRRQRVAEGRAADGMAGDQARPAGAAGADARRDVSSRAPHVCPHSRAHRLCERRTYHLPGHPGGLPAGRLRRHRHACGQQGQLFGVRPLPRRARAHRRASAALTHDPKHGVSRIRHAAGVMGCRITAERSGRRARHRSGGNSTTQPARKGRGLQPARYAGRWRLAQACLRQPPAQSTGTLRLRRIADVASRSG